MNLFPGMEIVRRQKTRGPSSYWSGRSSIGHIPSFESGHFAKPRCELIFPACRGHGGIDDRTEKYLNFFPGGQFASAGAPCGGIRAAEFGCGGGRGGKG